MGLTNNQQLRYSRHITLPELGEEGQEALLRSRVLVVGAGGLGSPLLLYLAASGVGVIGVVDQDKVELSNLQRQIIHETGDVGRYKVDSSVDAIRDLNPDVTVETFHTRLDQSNIEEIAASFDIIADGSDNFETRFLVADYCAKAKKPLVSAAIHGFSGQLSVFTPYLGDTHPCYRCFYPEEPPKEILPNCSESGVLGAVAGILGAWQATEVVKELLQIGERLSGSLVMLDTLTTVSRKVALPKDPKCVCSQG